MNNDKPEAASTSEAAPSVEQKNPTALLLGAISYDNKDDYENFLNNLSLEHAVIVLISAANYAQSKGAYNLNEAELIAKAIKRLSTKNKETVATAPEPNQDDSPST
jgi:hypothetical protein